MTLGVARAATEERFGITGEAMSKEGDNPNKVLLTEGSKDVTEKVESGIVEETTGVADRTLEETTGVAEDEEAICFRKKILHMF